MEETLNLLRQPKRHVGFFISMGAACLLFYFLPQRSFEGDFVIGEWYSVMPPLVAVGAALFYRNLVVALTAAFLTGTFLTYGLNPIVALPNAFETFILQNLKDGFNIFCHLVKGF